MFRIVFWFLTLSLPHSVSYSSLTVEEEVFFKKKSIHKLFYFENLDSAQDLHSHSIKVLVWNVFKSKKSRWYNTFLKLSKNNDLILLQESVLDPEDKTSPYYSFPSFHMAFSFETSKGFTGVLTATKAIPDEVEPFFSPKKEPITGTAKTALASYYNLERSQRLMVVNIHGINFRRAKHLKAQLEAIGRKLAHHSGPVIFAGDFNTFTRAKKKVLYSFMEQHFLKEVGFKSAKHSVDKIFLRGCRVLQKKRHRVFYASDHPALWVEVQCKS